MPIVDTAGDRVRVPVGVMCGLTNPFCDERMLDVCNVSRV